MQKLYFKSSFIFLLIFTVFLFISAIRYFIIFSSPDYYGEMGDTVATLFYVLAIPYFLIFTYISYLNFRKKKDNTLFFLIFISAIIPSLFIFYLYFRISLEGIIE